MGGTGTVPARLHLMGGSNVGGYLKQTAYAVQRINGSVLTNGGGFIYTFAPATRTLTRTSSASQTMASFFRRTWSRLASAISTGSAQALKVYAANRTARATHVRAASVSKIANFVRTVKATHVRAANALKLRLVTKQAKATQVVSASVTKQVSLTRRASVTVNYAIRSSKARTLVRRAVATTTSVGKLAWNVNFRTHPGKMTIGITRASMALGTARASATFGKSTATMTIGME
jgi:hypothetical protein